MTPLAFAHDAQVAAARTVLNGLPVRFEPNQGQWEPAVRFSARAGGGRIFLTSRGALLAYGSPGGGQARSTAISLLNGNPAPVISGLDPAGSQSNFFLGNDTRNWRTGVSHYGRVRYEAVYPGIDMLYYGSGEQLEYDFTLQPGADPSRIRLKFRGTGRLALTADGDLVMGDGGSRLLQKRPRLYQDGREIGGRYRLLGRNIAGVEVGAYDSSRALTIDPVLLYGTYLGADAVDAITGVQADAAGMLYVAGYTYNGTLHSKGGPFQDTSKGGVDIFVAKFDPSKSGSASLLSFTYIGGSGNDMANAMALDSRGRVYVTGSTTSKDFPWRGWAQQAKFGGATDAFILRLDTTISGADALTYADYLGGTDFDAGYAIAIDAGGRIYVAGSTSSTDFPATSGAYQHGKWGNRDAFVAKIDPEQSTSVLYASYLGGELSEDGRAVAAGPDGTIYVAGSTASTMFPYTGGAYKTELQGGVDGFFSKIDPARSGEASLVYSTYIGGSALDVIRAMAVDASGNVIVVGDTLSSNFPVTPDAYQSKLHGNADAFVTKLDLTNGGRPIVYSTYLGGGAGDVAYGVAVDSTGSIYVSGYTLSLDFPTSTDGLLRSFGGGVEAFIAKLDPAGALAYSTYIGKAGSHVAYSIAVGADGKIYTGGIVAIGGIPITPSAVQGAVGGGFYDGWVIVLVP